ncbi:MAG: virulence RhuM family protein [Acholeplasmataceae bacterium]|nr:virulence RhuM family protein [Acholeplasmataceae bacterium]
MNHPTKASHVIAFRDGGLEIDVTIDHERDTVWLTQKQMGELFDVTTDNIGLHIRNIFKEEELIASSVTEKSSVTASDGKKYKTNLYNLDVAISVGYRVKSKRGIIFRKWANQILKEYIYKGYLVDKERLIKHKEYYKAFTNSVKLIADLIERKELEAEESKSLLQIISRYAYALETLDKYDHQSLTITNITKDDKKIKLDYEDAVKEIKGLPDYGKTQWFGKEKDHSFHGALNAIYQTAFGEEVYPSIEEKAANLLYFIVKDHAFYDGNKRIAASIFLWFLDIYGILYKKDGSRILDDNALVAIVLMIALSHPNEKDTIVKMIINLINQNN